MTKQPDYWIGLPPMYYSTHVMSPITGIADSRLRSDSRFGSGIVDPEFHANSGNIYPVETAAGILAHEPAMRDGEKIEIPEF